MKILLSFLIFSLSLTLPIQAQIITPTRFPLQSAGQDYQESFILGLPNNDLIMFWYDSVSSDIKSARSRDNGNSWIDEDTLFSFSSSPQFRPDFNAIVLNSGRVLFTYRSTNYKFIFSDDNCNSWSAQASLPTRPTSVGRLGVYWSSLGKVSDGSVLFVHSFTSSNNKYDAKGVYTIRSIDGNNWFSLDTIDVNGRNGNLVNIGNSKDLIVYHDSTENSNDIFFRLSTDSGISWSDRTLLVGGINSQKNARGIKDQYGKTWIFFEDEEQTSFNGITQPDINFFTSTDEGNTWSNKQKFTSYTGIDDNLALSIWDSKPILTFSSSRSFSLHNQKMQLYYGVGGETIDTNSPPYLFKHSIIPELITQQEPVTFRACILDDTGVDSVFIITRLNELTAEHHQMFDDGLHNDSLPNDNIYGVIFQSGFNNGDVVFYDYLLKDIDGNQSGFSISFLTFPSLPLINKYLLEVNNLKLPLDNRGVLAAVDIDGVSGLKFDESSVLFSGGFFISGNNGLTDWATGLATSTLVEYFIPGPLGSDPNDIRNSIYVIKKTDPDFSASWQRYRYAVVNGADFYDGDNDGIYNPIDLNGNTVWDADEAKPDIHGDKTVFCVYNDGAPASWRIRIPGEPQGIDIQQTLFAVNENLNPIQNMLFIRYRIINRGTIADNFEDVYFTVWSDPDIGVGYSDKILGINDDLVGCDTLLNVGYCYNDSLDTSYGSNPPALGTAILQGPVVYIPNETFIDVNGNGLFDLGIDTPLDSANINNGLLGTNQFPGAKNLGMTSFFYTDCGSIIMGEPNSVEQVRFLMAGKNIMGEFTDPCNWQFGFVNGVPCNQVNPIYHYSGDPVNSFGWIHNTPCDQRMWTNIGPFNLPQNEKVDIWIAYIVGRGNDNLNSVTKLKEYTAAAYNFYNSNFTQLPVKVEDEKMIVDDYILFQNYPNPFNPSTAIKYSISQDGIVTIKIFDILGQEVTTLKNEFQKANTYEVNFNASYLPSGVYFYQLRSRSFLETKKMLLIK